MNFLSKTLSVAFRLKKNESLSKIDIAFLQVSLMVAALDGSIDASEFSTFDRQIRKCPGYSIESANKAREIAIRAAGYLLAQRFRLNAQALSDVFVGEVLKVVNPERAIENPVQLRRAFVTWVAMAMADGAFTSIERTCLNALHRQLYNAAIGFAEKQFSAANERAHAYIPRDEREAFVKRIINERWPKDFLQRAEKALAFIAKDVTSPIAARALRELIGE